MKLGKGVEWAAHTCALLALLPPKATLPGDSLADFLGIPSPYLAKQLQAMSRAGIVAAKRGASGGYRLQKPAESISLWDITASIEGTAHSFRCTEVRRSGPCGAVKAECKRPCPIAATFYDAERRYRETLDSMKLTDIVSAVALEANQNRKDRIKDWVQHNAALPA
ncbi:MAG: Rrf2 family transcriptional regulator [Pseudomonadota bacterium]